MRAVASILVLCLSAAAYGQSVSLTVTPGASLFIEENQILNGERNIAVEVIGNPDAALTVTATSGSSAIRYLRVRSRRGTGFETGEIVVTVREGGGTVAHVREISRLPTLNQAELGIGLVSISGIAGPPNGPDGTAFQAEHVNQITAGGPNHRIFQANGLPGVPLLRRGFGRRE
ncbi:hypothetical protein PHYC_01266 [Phycisphaerales bacterium]|nr:hypothetical protein PHYC_01266 [Phycisphaerales bacterium]